MRAVLKLAVVLVAAFVAMAACERVPDSVRERANAVDAAAATPVTVAPPVAQPRASASGSPPGVAGKVEWVDAPAGTTDASAFVRTQLARAKASGRSVIVEIGASWCEPCKRFHAAATSGQLDAAFPTLTVVSFSLDDELEREALVVAGYNSKLIPLFALPKADGTASGKQIEGSIHGEGSPDEITPRLRALLSS